MSPVLILSRLCLNRRFQFFGMSETSSRSTLSTFSTVSSSITRRSPASAAFSVGTITVMSLCRILIVRYSRRWPKTSLISLALTCPAPWWGYTTLSPSSNSMTSAVIVTSMSSSGSRPASSSRPTSSGLQVAVHEVDFLQPAKALADVLRPNLSHAVDRLELGVARGEQVVKAAEPADDARDDELRQARDATEDAVAARRDRVVERADLAVVAQQL